MIFFRKNRPHSPHPPSIPKSILQGSKQGQKSPLLFIYASKSNPYAGFRGSVGGIKSKDEEGRRGEMGPEEVSEYSFTGFSASAPNSI
jgi:hypothetical protein